MTPTLLFYIIIAILVVDFVVDLILTYLNAQKFDEPIPNELEGLYDEEAYGRSQAYKKANYRFGLVNGFVTFTSTLLFLILGERWNDSCH